MTSYRQWSVRTKMMVSLCVIFGALLLIIGTAAVYSTKRLLTRALIEKGNILTESLEKASVYGVSTDNVLKDLDSLIQTAHTHSDVVYAAVLGSGGRVLASVGDGSPPALRAQHSVRRTEAGFEFVYIILASERFPSFGGATTGVIGNAIITLSAVSLNKKIATLSASITVIIFILLLSTILFSYFFSISITHRLDLLLNACEQIEHGEKVEAMADSRDEIGLLSRKMIETLTQLAATQRYVTSILHAVTNILIVIDSKCRIKTINAAAVSVLGYSEQELIGRSVESLFPPEEILKVTTRV